jgi:predicted RNase H-like HicB family nuclease
MHYTAAITREGKYLLAEILDAPGCQTFAESEEELLREAQEALAGWLEAHLIDGELPSRPKARMQAPTGAMLRRVEVAPTLARVLEIGWHAESRGPGS